MPEIKNIYWWDKWPMGSTEKKNCEWKLTKTHSKRIKKRTSVSYRTTLSGLLCV